MFKNKVLIIFLLIGISLILLFGWKNSNQSAANLQTSIIYTPEVKTEVNNVETSNLPISNSERIIFLSNELKYSSEVVENQSELVFSEQQDEIETFKAKIEALGITLHPGTNFVSESQSSPETELHCQSLVHQTLTILPTETVEQLKNLTLYYHDTGRRGLGGGSTIILRCQNVTDYELVSVLVHEMGHIQDTGVMKGAFWAGESEFMDGNNPVYNNDLSLDFYRLSFLDEKTLKNGVLQQDFVSGYAMTNPFEDFAESYNFYLLHGDDFRYMASKNDLLAKKYQFLKDKVFAGQEFDLKDGLQVANEEIRSYDSTKLYYNLNNFLKD